MVVKGIVARWHPYGSTPQRRAIESEVDAFGLLTALAQGDRGRVVVDFELPSGASLTVAVGGTVSALGYQGTADPPYFASLGDGQQPSEDFSFGGQYTEFPQDAYVPIPAATSAVAQFVNTGELPTCLRWQQV